MLQDIEETDIDSDLSIQRQLDKQQELLDQQQSSSSSLINTALATLQTSLQSNQQQPDAQLLLQQLIKQILYAPIVNVKCPKPMRDSILYCTSYIEAKISTKMPYILVLDKRIAELHRKHNEFVTPALLLSRGRSRNVTVDINTTHKVVPSCRLTTSGHSEYSIYPKQQVRLVYGGGRRGWRSRRRIAFIYFNYFYISLIFIKFSLIASNSAP